MQRRIILLVCAVGSLSSCLGAGSGPSLEEDLAAIAQLRAEHVRGVNSTDAGLVLSGFAEEVAYLGPGLDPILGIDALRAFLQPVYEQVHMNISMTPNDVQVVGDVAYEWGSISGRIVMAPDAPPQAVNAKYVYVYRRQRDGSWRIVYDIYNDNASDSR
jgi:uncharacterized protein (TIGR02246 family)